MYLHTWSLRALELRQQDSCKQEFEILLLQPWVCSSTATKTEQDSCFGSFGATTNVSINKKTRFSINKILVWASFIYRRLRLHQQDFSSKQGIVRAQSVRARTAACPVLIETPYLYYTAAPQCCAWCSSSLNEFACKSTATRAQTINRVNNNVILTFCFCCFISFCWILRSE